MEQFDLFGAVETYETQMEHAKTLEAGRAVTRRLETEIHDLQVSAGLPPSVGKDAHERADRAFVAVKPGEWEEAIGAMAAVSPAKSMRLSGLVLDGRRAWAVWTRLVNSMIEGRVA